MKKTLLNTAMLLCCVSTNAFANNLPPVGVKTIHAVPHEFNNITNAPAFATAYAQAELGAMLSGAISELHVDIGDKVTKGQLLAKINVPEMAAQITAQKSTVKALSSEYTRISALVNKRAMSEKTKTEAKQRLDAANAELARVNSLLEYTSIKAPFDGVIVERNIDVGDVVFEAKSPKGDNTPLLTVANINKIRVITDVAGKKARWVDVGDKASIEFDSLRGQIFTGSIARTSNQLTPNTHTLKVEIDLDNSTGDILPGYYGSAEIVLDNTAKGLSLPNSAIRTDEQGAFIYIAENNKAKRINVKLGAEDGNLQLISSGLNGNEKIINGVIGRLTDGQAVQLY